MKASRNRRPAQSSRAIGPAACCLAALLLAGLVPAAQAGRQQSSSFIAEPSQTGQGGQKGTSAAFKNSNAAQEVGGAGSSSAGFLGRAGLHGGLPVPSKIADLTDAEVFITSATLEWSAPFADQEHSTGTAAKYLIRYRTDTPITTDEGFRTATVYNNSFNPLPPGLLESRQITGLSPASTYYFVVESANEHSVRSFRSDSLTVVTLPDTQNCWDGEAGDGNWYTAKNWAKDIVPTASHDACILVAANVRVEASSPSITFNSLTLGDGSAVVGLTISTTILNGGDLTIRGNAGLTFATTHQSVINGDVTMLSGSSMTHTANTNALARSLDLRVTGAFDLQDGATITVTGKGYAAKQGPGKPSNNSSGGGAGHGGEGGTGSAAGGPAYGSLTDPVDLGSGGADSNFDGSAGGAGGGAVRLDVAGTLALNGLITADGAAGAGGFDDGGGGGAGGSINLAAANLSGAGTLRARGGNGGSGGTTLGGGGAGGRLHVCADVNDFVGPTDVGGGTGGQAGGLGTVVSSTTLRDHGLGQTPDDFREVAVSSVTLHRFELVLSSGGVTVNPLLFDLSGASGLAAEDFEHTQLYLDLNKDGRADDGDTSLGAGAVTLPGAAGDITFSNDMVFTGSGTFSFVLASTVTLVGGQDLTVSLAAGDISAQCPDGSGALGIRLGTSDDAVHTIGVDTCGARTSAQSGLWSLDSTWSPASVPTDCSPVTIASGHQVTVDITTATASTTTINGHLYFSRTASSSFTVVGGSISVNAGGWLDLGTEADVLGPAATAHLVLAYGSGGDRFGLTVFDGGDFTVRGSTKSPYGLATSPIPAGGSVLTISASSSTGWNVGDLISIGPTTGSGTSSVWRATITVMSGGDPRSVAFDPAIDDGRVPTATSPVVVANLTRNVLVRSSGTDTGSDTAFLQNLATNATSFSLGYGEFAHLGKGGDLAGVTFAGSATRGSISSSTLRDGGDISIIGASRVRVANSVVDGGGLTFKNALDCDILDNALYRGNRAVSVIDSSNLRIERNFIYGGPSRGIDIDGVNGQSERNRIAFNHIFSIEVMCIEIERSSLNSVIGNRIYRCANGIRLWGPGTDDNLLAGNFFYNHSLNGIQVINDSGGPRRLTSTGDRFYGSAADAILLDNLRQALFSDAVFGYDENGVSAPNNPEISFVATSKSNVQLQGARINPASGIDTSNLNESNEYVLSYDQDYDTGTVRLWGDYALSGSTWTFQHDVRVSTSLFTTPKLMRGVGGSHSASVCSTSDADAVSQLVTLEYNGTNWTVTGSSTGAMGTIAAGSCESIGGGQAEVDITESGTPAVSDRLDFALIAASPIQNIRKRLLFGPAASSFNQGKSKLTVAPSGGLVFRGQEGEHTLIDRLDSGSTYYTFVDSGAFTAHFSSFTNMDLDGIQLSGSAGVSIATSTFDLLGLAGTENAYITARDLSSHATFYSVTFDDSRASVGVSSANVRVEGSDAGLFWRFITRGGGLWGEDFDDDATDIVRWGGEAPTDPIIAAVYHTSATVTFGGVVADAYVVEASLDSGFSSVISSQTLNTDLTTLSPQGLLPNTTYYFRAGALWGNTTAYANTTPASTSTLANQVAGTQVFGVWRTSITVNWLPLPASPQEDTSEGYILETSTRADFAPLWGSSTTTNVALSTLTISDLYGGNTYYFRVGSLNWNSVPHYAVTVSTFLETVLSIFIPDDDIDLQTLLLGEDVVVATSTYVTNDGNVRETYNFRATTITANSPWAIDTAQGLNRFVLWTIIDSGTSPPTSGAFGNEDKLAEDSQQASATVFTNGNGTGVAVPYDELRRLWMRLGMPNSSSVIGEQRFTVIITAEEAP